MAFVAIYTFGRLKHPYEHPASREFFEVGYEVMRQAAKSGRRLRMCPGRRLSRDTTIIFNMDLLLLRLTISTLLMKLGRHTLLNNLGQFSCFR